MHVFLVNTSNTVDNLVKFVSINMTETYGVCTL